MNRKYIDTQKYDLTSRIITFLVFILLTPIFIDLFNIYGSDQQNVTKIVIYTSIILLLAIISLFSSKNYSIDDNSIILYSYISKRVIPLESIKSITLFEEDSTMIRIFGSGGFLGFWGRFKSKKYPNLILHSTVNVKPENGLILIVTDRNNFIISPKEIKPFLDLKHK